MASQGQSAASIFDINLRPGTRVVLAVVVAIVIIGVPSAQAQTYTALCTAQRGMVDRTAPATNRTSPDVEPSSGWRRNPQLATTRSVHGRRRCSIASPAAPTMAPFPRPRLLSTRREIFWEQLSPAVSTQRIAITATTGVARSLSWPTPMAAGRKVCPISLLAAVMGRIRWPD